MVITSTLSSGRRRTSSRVVSMPESFPRCRSMSITSTFSPGRASASSWEAAWPTTSMSGSDESSAAMPSRNTGWSSTTATRTVSATHAHRPRDLGAHAGAAAVRLLHPEPATLLLGALAHRPAPYAGPRVGSDAEAVVLDRDREGPPGGSRLHHAAGGRAVPRDVGDSLADDAVRRGGELQAEPLEPAEGELDGETVLGMPSPHLVERGGQAELVEHRREQAV